MTKVVPLQPETVYSAEQQVLVNEVSRILNIFKTKKLSFARDDE